MCYPNGQAARAGDMIWMGGRVRKVIEVVSAARAPLFGDVDGGIFVSRHIGPFDAGGLLYVSRHDLEQEWVSPLAEADRDEIEGLYKALGGILHQEIWGNPRYAYHPVLLVETAGGGEEEVWYLFLQPSQDVRRTSDTEVCYAYHTKSKRFEQVPHSRRYDMIRGLVEARGGGCESDEGAAPLRG